MAPKHTALRRAQGVLTAFQHINDTLPIQIAISFITVALYEGRSLREYCDLTGVAQSTMSRHLLDLGERNRKKEPGFHLVEQRSDTNDLRRNIYRLTPKGEKLAHDIAEAVESAT